MRRIAAVGRTWDEDGWGLLARTRAEACTAVPFVHTAGCPYVARMFLERTALELAIVLVLLLAVVLAIWVVFDLPNWWQGVGSAFGTWIGIVSLSLVARRRRLKGRA